MTKKQPGLHCSPTTQHQKLPMSITTKKHLRNMHAFPELAK